MTKHHAPVEPLNLDSAAASLHRLFLPAAGEEIKSISLTLLLLARYGTILCGIINLFPNPNVSMINELDLKVKNLLLEALTALEYSQRLRKIESLLDLTDYLPNSRTKNRIDIGLQPYFDDAIQDTARYMTKNLEKFLERYDLNINDASPSEVSLCFVRWYNLNIKSDCIDQRRKHKKIKFVNLDETVNESNATSKEEITPDPNPKAPIEDVEQKRLFQELKAYLAEDPEQRLRNAASKKYPICNCWELIKRRVLASPPQTFGEIKESLNIPIDNVTRLWYNKAVPLLKEIAAEIGYEIDPTNHNQKRGDSHE